MEWAPKVATASMLIRWAHRAKRHFNSDSIALLACLTEKVRESLGSVAKQSQGAPHDLLKFLLQFKS
eukprot:13560279-Ditylum_brightwellii.AAC.1